MARADSPPPPDAPAPADSATDLDAKASGIVAEESDIAANVARRLAERIADPANADVQRARGDFNADLVSLRDQIGDARNEDVPALLAEMMRLAAVRSVDAPEHQGQVDPKKPYFGHLRLKETILRKRGRPEEVVRDVLIGKQSLVDRAAGIVIVDWRDAPVSRLYYRYTEGDDYEERFGDETREGEVDVRRTITFDSGELVRIKDDSRVLIKRRSEAEDAKWVALPVLAPIDLAGGAGTAARVPPQSGRTGPQRFGHEGPAHTRADRHLPEIAALIDGKQFDAMTGPGGGVVILQGGAGSGKTTVALHRLAYLSYNDPQRFRPNRMLFVVRQPALVRYVERVLPSLDVAAVRVRAYTDWALSALRYCITGPLPDLSTNPPVEVARLKKHPSIMKAISIQAERRFTEAMAAVRHRVTDQPDAKIVLELVRDATQNPTPLVLRLQRLRQRVLARRMDRATKERAVKVIEQFERTCADLLTEWTELVTDEALLDGALFDIDEAAALSDAEFRRALDWTALQVDDPDPDEIDPEKKRAVDGEEEDPGPTQKLDEHDLPILLLICIARYGCIRSRRNDRPFSYDHIAVDEAQDLASVELAPLLNCAKPHNSVTLAGDVVQKVVFDNGFTRWAQLLDQLGIAAREVEPLRLTYRSSGPIVQFAHEALGPLAPKTPPQASRGGRAVEAFGFEETGEEIAFLAQHLRSVMSREPRATVAILCRYKARAEFLHKMLKEADVQHLRLVLHDEFKFTPGIDVADIAGAKGLEYDYVIVPEASTAMFPDDDVARHLLHIGATRAAFQLWLTYTGVASPLVPAHYRREDV